MKGNLYRTKSPFKSNSDLLPLLVVSNLTTTNRMIPGIKLSIKKAIIDIHITIISSNIILNINNKTSTKVRKEISKTDRIHLGNIEKWSVMLITQPK